MEDNDNKEQTNKNNYQLNYQLSNKDKYYFYIGHIFNDPLLISELINLRKSLKTTFTLKDSYWNNKLFANIMYIGYFSIDIAHSYMENIITPLLKAISEKIGQLECTLTKLRIIKIKDNLNKITLEFTDTNDYLNKTIIPYIHNHAIAEIYEKRSNVLSPPSINMIYYTSSPVLNSINKRNELYEKLNNKLETLKTKRFRLEQISLIKGIPFQYRTGTPSKNNRMSIEEIKRYNVML